MDTNRKVYKEFGHLKYMSKLAKLGVLGLASLLTGCVTSSFNDHTDQKYSRNKVDTYSDRVLLEVKEVLERDIKYNMPQNYYRIKRTTWKVEIKEE